jgi:hypothetical protein
VAGILAVLGLSSRVVRTMKLRLRDLLAGVAFLLMRQDDLFDRVGKAETAAAEVLLAVFMGSILVVWAIELMDHAGILPGSGHRTGLRYR